MPKLFRVLFLLVVAGFPLSGSEAQSQRTPQQTQPPINPPRAQPAQPAAPDQRGTDQAPLAVKIIPSAKSAEETEKEERDRRQKDEKAAIDKRLADDTQRLANETGNLSFYTGGLAIFTLFVFCAAVGQVALFWWQLLLIRKSLADAKKSADAATAGAIAAKEAADAAKLNAEAVMGAERAHLFLSFNGHEIGDRIVRAASVDEPNMQSAHADPPIKIAYHFKNYGKTPAILIGLSHHFVNRVSVGSTLDYAPILDFPVGLVIAAGDESEPFECAAESTITVEQARAIRDGGSSLWFYGYAQFKDIFDGEREVRWRYQYQGRNGGFRHVYYNEAPKKQS